VFDQDWEGLPKLALVLPAIIEAWAADDAGAMAEQVGILDELGPKAWAMAIATYASFVAIFGGATVTKDAGPAAAAAVIIIECVESKAFAEAEYLAENLSEHMRREVLTVLVEGVVIIHAAMVEQEAKRRGARAN
jgi:acid phosphatase family membrane protein YuiD